MNKKNLIILVSIIFLLGIFYFVKAATPNFVTGLSIGSGYKINFAGNTDGVTWTNGTGGSIDAANYTGKAATASALSSNPTNCSAGYYPLGIDASGNVESCTAAGGISGSGTAGYVPKWSGASALGNSVIYASGNKVGIGITNPSAYLEVTTNTSVSGGDLEVIRLGGNYNASLGGSNSIAWYGWINTNKIAAISGALDSNQKGILTFSVGGSDTTAVSEAMRINYDGRVGIATTTLNTILNLGGKPGIDGLQFPDGTIQTTAAGTGSVTAANVSAGVFGANTGGGNYAFPSGVGIGTTDLKGALDVSEPKLESAIQGIVTIESKSASLGTPFIRMLNSSGSPFMDINANCGSEIFIGVGAGANVQTGSCSGALFIGSNAGNLSLSSFNVALGPFALSTNRSGVQNTTVGSNSMGYSTGSYNAALGSYAMVNQTGSNNIAIGYQALNASESNSASSNNIAIGSNALAAYGGGGGTVAIGSGAGYSDTQGSSVYIGHQAGYSNSSGSSNVYIGYRAGYSETSGDNELFIENSSASIPLIYGSFSADQVGINTKTMRETLNVGGKVTATGFCMGTDCRTSWANTGVYSAAANGTTAFNFNSANVFRVTPTATATYTATVGPAGQRATIIILSSGTTSRTITFGTGFKANGTLATGTVSGKYFSISFVSDGSYMVEAGRVATGM